MDTIRCAVTGVELNPITVERPQLSFKEAVAAWVMKLQGTKYNHIAQHLGTNTFRIGEVLRGEVHPNARQQALSLLALEDFLDPQEPNVALRVPRRKRAAPTSDQPRLI